MVLDSYCCCDKEYFVTNLKMIKKITITHLGTARSVGDEGEFELWCDGPAEDLSKPLNQACRNHSKYHNIKKNLLV